MGIVAIYSKEGNLRRLYGFNSTKRDALSASPFTISTVLTRQLYLPLNPVSMQCSYFQYKDIPGSLNVPSSPRLMMRSRYDRCQLVLDLSVSLNLKNGRNLVEIYDVKDGEIFL